MTATKEIIKEWLEELNNGNLPICVVDDDGVFNSSMGLEPGNYVALTEIVEKGITFAAYTGQTGCEKNPNRCLRVRLTEHLRRWLNSPEYHLGVKAEELAVGKVRIHISVLSSGNCSFDLRKRLEKASVYTHKPFLQYGPWKKYNTTYEGEDLSIVPFGHTRRKAFLARARQSGVFLEDSTTNTIDRIFDIVLGSDLCRLAKCRSGKRDFNTAMEVRKALKNGTNEYLVIKAIFDKQLYNGKKPKRGCSYDYITDVLTYAIEQTA